MNTDASSGLIRFAALTVFAGLPILFLALAISNVASASASRQQIAGQRKMLGELSARLNILIPQDTADTSVLYLSGNTSSLAAADLRRRISAAVATAGGRLIETRFVEHDETEQRSDVLSLGATLDIDNDGLARFLYGVESGLPIMDVRTLSLRRLNGSERGTEEDSLLRTDIVVEAFRKGDTP